MGGFPTGEAHRRWCLDFPRRRFLRGGLDAGEKVSQVAVSCMLLPHAKSSERETE